MVLGTFYRETRENHGKYVTWEYTGWVAGGISIPEIGECKPMSVDGASFFISTIFFIPVCPRFFRDISHTNVITSKMQTSIQNLEMQEKLDPRIQWETIKKSIEK